MTTRLVEVVPDEPMDAIETLSGLSAWWISIKKPPRPDQLDQWQDVSLRICDGLDDESRGRLLNYAFRIEQWRVAARILDRPLSEARKSEVFRLNSGLSAARADLVASFDEKIPEGAAKIGAVDSFLSNIQDGYNYREVKLFLLGFAVVAGYAEQHRDVLSSIPPWMLAECIRLDGDGGGCLLEMCFEDRDGKVTWERSGHQHDQMAFLGPWPHTLLMDKSDRLESRQSALLPHFANMAYLSDRWNRVAKTRGRVRVFTIGGACCPAVVKALAESPTNKPLETDAALAIVEFAWQFILIPYFVDFLINICYICLLCRAFEAVRSGDDVHVTYVVFFLLATIKAITEEILQLFDTDVTSFGSQCRRASRSLRAYFVSFEQVHDWVGIGVDVLGIIVLSTSATEPWGRAALAVWAVERWLKALFSMRGNRLIGPKMLPILLALQDTFMFLVVVCFFLGAAVQAYYILGVRSEPGPFYAALLPMLRLSLLGDFDMYELEGEDTIYVPGDGPGELTPQDPSPTAMYAFVHALFYVVVVSITLTLMNLLIGILGSNYDRYEAQSLPIFLRCRALIITRYLSFPWALVGCRWKAKLREGYLWVATRAERNVDEIRSMRETFQNELERATEQQQQQLRAELDRAMKQQQQQFRAELDRAMAAAAAAG